MWPTTCYPLGATTAFATGDSAGCTQAQRVCQHGGVCRCINQAFAEQRDALHRRQAGKRRVIGGTRPWQQAAYLPLLLLGSEPASLAFLACSPLIRESCYEQVERLHVKDTVGDRRRALVALAEV